MPADLTNPFGPSCCDGGVCDVSGQSAQPCGCDPGIGWVSESCWLHQPQGVTTIIQPIDDIRELGMKVKDFEEFVVTKGKQPLDKGAYSFVGLAGETGEVLDWYKKTTLRDTPTKLTDEDLKLELGDVLHYLTRIAKVYGWGLKDIMDANKTKLDKRYGRV